MLSRVKKNDLVYITSGKDKGKQGRVISINVKHEEVMVKGVAIATRHVKPRRQGQAGGITQTESYIPLAKVMPICAACKKPCRVQVRFLENSDEKARICHRCKEAF